MYGAKRKREHYQIMVMDQVTLGVQAKKQDWPRSSGGVSLLLLGLINDSYGFKLFLLTIPHDSMNKLSHKHIIKLSQKYINANRAVLKRYKCEKKKTSRSASDTIGSGHKLFVVYQDVGETKACGAGRSKY